MSASSSTCRAPRGRRGKQERRARRGVQPAPAVPRREQEHPALRVGPPGAGAVPAPAPRAARVQRVRSVFTAWTGPAMRARSTTTASAQASRAVTRGFIAASNASRRPTAATAFVATPSRTGAWRAVVRTMPARRAPTAAIGVGWFAFNATGIRNARARRSGTCARWTEAAASSVEPTRIATPRAVTVSPDAAWSAGTGATAAPGCASRSRTCACLAPRRMLEECGRFGDPRLASAGVRAAGTRGRSRSRARGSRCTGRGGRSRSDRPRRRTRRRTSRRSASPSARRARAWSRPNRL
jgi:hypothetical protein